MSTFADLAEDAPAKATFADLANDASTPPPPPPVKVASKAPAKPAVDPEMEAAYQRQRSLGRFLMTQGSGLVSNIVGGFHGVGTTIGNLASGESLSHSLNQGADDVRDFTDRYTYQPPADDTAATKANAGFSSGYNPLTWPTRAGDAVGDKVMDLTGSPGVSATANAAVNGLGSLLLPKLGGRVIARGVEARFPAGAPAVPAPRVEPALADNPTPGFTPSQATAPAAPVPVRQAAANDPVKFSDPQRGVFAAANDDAPGGVPKTEQDRRAAVLNEIGLANARRSAISGDKQAAGTDFQMSRVDNPAGSALKQQLEHEKSTIQNYASKIVDDTGGTGMQPNNVQGIRYARGQNIVAPIDALRGWFDAKTSEFYKIADERAQGVPTNLDQFRTVLGDDSLATNPDRVQFRQAVQSFAKKLGVVDDQGNVFANGQQAETMRKYLNQHWSPQNSGLVGALKDALDQDVISSAGEDVYAEARKMRTQRARTLDDPKGISQLADADGINRAVDFEKVPTRITSMPVDQFGHVIETLKSMPDELQPHAQQALAEIKAQFANDIHDIGSSQAGQWNAKGVSKYLATHSKQLAQVFTPEEMQRFGTLNDAGHILAKDQSYPGAAAQGHNLVRSGVMGAVQHGATAAGATVGSILGPVGTGAGGVAGNMIGAKLAGGIETRAQLKAAQARIVKLSDMLPKTGAP